MKYFVDNVGGPVRMLARVEVGEGASREEFDRAPSSYWSYRDGNWYRFNEPVGTLQIELRGGDEWFALPATEVDRVQREMIASGGTAVVSGDL